MDENDFSDAPRIAALESRLDRLENRVDALCAVLEAHLDIPPLQFETRGDALPLIAGPAHSPWNAEEGGLASATALEPPASPVTSEWPDALVGAPVEADAPAEPEDPDEPKTVDPKPVDDPESAAATEAEDQAEMVDESASDAESESATAPPSSTDAGSSEESTDTPFQRYTTSLNLRSEDWISYVGVGLFLFGLAFLFKHSVEQGWITPTVRIGFGVFTGGVLLAGGIRRMDDRPLLQQILFGGSSATFYGTIFAAYQLYGMLPYAVAFGGMIVVTVATIVLGLRQDYPSTAFIGTAGGLGTPFLLYSEADGGAGLALYTCLVLAEACAVYLYRGWRSLLYLALAGGWIVLLLPASQPAATHTLPGDWGIQISIALAWVLLGGSPVLRALLRSRHPEQWPAAPFQPLSALLGNRPLYLPITSSPFLALLATRLLWFDVPDAVWAVVAGSGAAVYIGLYGVLRRESLWRYLPVHGLVAVVLATYSVSEAAGGATRLVTWAVEAALLLVLAQRLNDIVFRVSGHLLFAAVFGVLGKRLLIPEPYAIALVPPGALSELAVLAIGIGGLLWTYNRAFRQLYWGALLIGWFGWWANELLPLAYGAEYLLLVGGLSALGLLWGRRDGEPVLNAAGHVAFAGLGIGLLHRFVRSPERIRPLLTGEALTELAVLGLGVLGLRRTARRPLRFFYQGGLVIGWFGWWGNELWQLPNGPEYLLLVGGVSAVPLLLLGDRRHEPVLYWAGHATSAVLLGSLLLRFAVGPARVRPLLTFAALSELAVMGLGVLALQFRSLRPMRGAYQSGLVVGWFGWWANELLPLPHGPDYLLIVAGLSALGLLLSGIRRSEAVLRGLGHATFAALLGSLFVRFPQPSTMPVLLTLSAASELLVLAAGGIASRLFQQKELRRFYEGFLLLSWLGWTLHEFVPLPNGHAYVSALWGATAVALLLGGAWARSPLVQKGGLAVLGLFVGKLFFVDLNTLSTLGRIALFLGTGSGFLGISYLLPGLGGTPSDAEKNGAAAHADE